MFYFLLGVFAGVALGFMMFALLSSRFHPRDLEEYEDEEFLTYIRKEKDEQEGRVIPEDSKQS